MKVFNSVALFEHDPADVRSGLGAEFSTASR
jgi:hypothetical protein